MSLTFDDVRKILRILDQSATSEIWLEYQDLKLVVRKGLAYRRASPAVTETSEQAQQDNTSDMPPSSLLEPPHPDAVPLQSPLAGTFYTAPSPEAPPFVCVGDRVDAAETVCIIDIMKVMNNVKAPVAGTVSRIDVKDADAIVAGQVLLWIRP